MDEDRRGPYESLAFALNMAIFTGGGDVYETSTLRAWLAAAGLASIEERRLASQPDGVVLVAYKPRGATAAFVATTGLDPEPIGLPSMPASFRTMLSHAAAYLHDENAVTLAEALAQHYTRVMPAMREQQLASPMFRARLDWDRMPRISAMLERFRALLAACEVSFDSARPATLAAFYERTYYGGFMPLLYGYPADLAYFEKRGRELGLDVVGTIDRYFAAPLLHELCHFGRDREALLPPHLDECIAGFIGVHVWPEMAFPEGDRDDAIYAAPWLSQVGQAVARAFGVRAVVRAHAGIEPWDAAVPRRFVDDATRLGWRDWCARRSQHFLADTFDPEPWVALARPYMRPDEAFDRAIVRDALRAMCLENLRVDGSFRTRTALPAAPIVIDRWVTTAKRNDVDRVAPRYWVPTTKRHEVTLASLDQIDDVVDYLMAT